MARAKLKSGRFVTKRRVYKRGDIISNIERVPISFRDMWEILPDRKVTAKKKIEDSTPDSSKSITTKKTPIKRSKISTKSNAKTNSK